MKSKNKKKLIAILTVLLLVALAVAFYLNKNEPQIEEPTEEIKENVPEKEDETIIEEVIEDTPEPEEKKDPVFYTVTFDPDGGHCNTSLKYTVEEGKSFTLIDTYRDHYTFEGWYLGDTLVKGSVKVNGNLTLKARWSVNTFYIDYQLDEGVLEEGTQTSFIWNESVGTLPIPLKNSSHFLGWHSQPDFSDEPVTSLGTLNSNVTLYAEYEPAVYYNYSDNETILHIYAYPAEDRQMRVLYYNCDNEAYCNGWWKKDTSTIVKAVIEEDLYATTYNGFFDYCTKLTTIENIERIRTDKATVLDYMFYKCIKLTDLDLSSFNTSNVTSMECVFWRCTTLKTLDLSSWDTAKVENMTALFKEDAKLNTVYVGSKWSVKKALDNGKTGNMFYGCSLIIGGNNTYYNKSFISGEYGVIDNPEHKGYLTAKVDDSIKVKVTYVLGDGAFDEEVQTEYSFGDSISSFPIAKKKEGASVYWHLKSDLSDDGFKTYKGLISDVTLYPEYTSAVYYSIDGENTILHIYSDDAEGRQLRILYEREDYSANEGWAKNTSLTKVVFEDDIYPESLCNFFRGNANISVIENIEKLHTENVTTLEKMFYGCKSLTSVNLSGFVTSEVETMLAMFQGCSKLTDLDLSSFDTSNVTSMNHLFTSCSALKSLNVSSFNTSNTTDMYGMFLGLNALTSLDVSNFNTSKVINMREMFSSCSKLAALDLSSFNTSDVTDMQNMFYNCKVLETINVSSFNTKKVTSMRNMFDSCQKLTSLDLSGFETDALKEMSYMFSGCSVLKTLDISKFNTANVTAMDSLLANCSKLKTVYVGSGWTTSKVSSNSNNFFLKCTSIVGGNGTTFSDSHKDIKYARIDKAGQPGYFTEKVD